MVCVYSDTTLRSATETFSIAGNRRQNVAGLI